MPGLKFSTPDAGSIYKSVCTLKKIYNEILSTVLSRVRGIIRSISMFLRNEIKCSDKSMVGIASGPNINRHVILGYNMEKDTIGREAD